MVRIANTAELRHAWSAIQKRFQRNPLLGAGFIQKPLETLRTMGYQLAPPAARALLAALP